MDSVVNTSFVRSEWFENKSMPSLESSIKFQLVASIFNSESTIIHFLLSTSNKQNLLFSIIYCYWLVQYLETLWYNINSIISSAFEIFNIFHTRFRPNYNYLNIYLAWASKLVSISYILISLMVNFLTFEHSASFSHF
jgi:hypothetical protein